MPREGASAAALCWRLGEAAQCEGLGCGWSATGAASLPADQCCAFDMSTEDMSYYQAKYQADNALVQWLQGISFLH